jgi:hypothetical protein
MFYAGPSPLSPIVKKSFDAPTQSFWDIDTHHYELTIIRLQRQMLAAQRIPAKLPAA